MKKPKPIRPTKKRIARIMDTPAGEVVVDLDINHRTIGVRRKGHRKGCRFAAEDMLALRNEGGLLTVVTSATVTHRDRKRFLAISITPATGQLSIRLDGLKARPKNYTLTDLFNWGPQLQLL
jgi:hypothetical protein